jgi:hypothetical protein
MSVARAESVIFPVAKKNHQKGENVKRLEGLEMFCSREAVGIVHAELQMQLLNSDTDNPLWDCFWHGSWWYFTTYEIQQ